jgi:transposase
MMGKHEPQKEMFSYPVDLDKRVRSDPPWRRINEIVDWSFIRGEVKECYGYNGNVSVDPAQVMKLLFLLFYDHVESERELMRIVRERLDYLWFLGWGLDDEVPDPSVRSKARKRWGPKGFERLFIRVVQRCVEAGLVEGRKIHVDGSLVDADASKNSVVKGSPELIEALRDAYQAQAKKLDEPEETATGQKYHEPVNDRAMSTTDPDAARVRKNADSRPRYKHHRVIDDAQGVITARETTPGSVKENGPLMRRVEQHETNTQVGVETVVADRQYGTAENFRACHDRGIRRHMGDLLEPQKEKGRREGLFPQEAFQYDAKTDTYRCPAGQVLNRRKHKTTRKCFEYAALGSTCSACGWRAQCTRAHSTARTIKRHYGQEAIEAARAESHSEQGQRDRARRQWLLEGSFADAANNHGFKRARWRRLWRQQIQDDLIATIQNARILLRHAERPLNAMAAAACSPLPTSTTLSLLRCRCSRSDYHSTRTLEIIFSDN